jgi:anti-sigma regulatory factor (Ser/Thr protein kinase)
MMERSVVFKIEESSQIGDARRLAAERARDLGFNDTKTGKISLIVTEAATNLLKHAGGGRLILRTLTDSGVNGIEILALDSGPGMANLADSLRDGHSTAGSPGTGLGAISRLSSFFDIYSMPGKGTVLVSQRWAKPGFKPSAPLELGAVCLPMASEISCGDAWAVRQAPDFTLLLVADGLGHGPMAAKAADEAVRVFESEVSITAPSELIKRAHGPMKATRGASVAVTGIFYGENQLRYSAVGNISGVLFNPNSSRNLISHNGTLGHELHRVQEFSYPWFRNSVLILHSDGLQTRWNLENFPGLISRHPSIIAGVLYREFSRGRDDVTILVARERPE